jgi:HEPN domain-containing protein
VPLQLQLQVSLSQVAKMIEEENIMSNKTDYWLELCDDDLITAKALLEAERFLWMGFICHLIVEKAIKAVIVDKTNQIPPKIHDLTKLACIGDIFEDMSNEQQDLLEKLLPLQIEARYPEYKSKVGEMISVEYYEELLEETEELLCWIKQKLGK